MGNATPKQIAPWLKEAQEPAKPVRPKPRLGLQGILVGLLGTAAAAAAFVLAPAADARLTSVEAPIAAARIDTASPTSLLTPPSTVPGTTVPFAPVTTAATTTTEAPRTTSTTLASVTTTSTIETTATTVSSSTTRSGQPTTTTTLAVTTTTAARTLLVRDISTSKVDSGASWIAVATISVSDDTGAPAAGAQVSVNWSTGASGQCTTDPSGKCTIYLPSLTVPAISLTTVSPSPGISRTITR